MYKDTMYIYIIREREFRRFGEPVWKPGMTANESIQKRFSQYPKGSELIFAARVSDAVAAEKELLQLLEAHTGLTHRKDIGREYFEGKLDVVYGVASMVCARYIKAADWEDENDSSQTDSNQSEDIMMDVDDITNDASAPETSTPLDSHLAVIKFVDDHRDVLNRATMTVVEVHDMFKKWVANEAVLPNVNTMQSKALSQALGKLFKVIHGTCNTNGQMNPAMIFPALIQTSVPDLQSKPAFQTKTCDLLHFLTASPDETRGHTHRYQVVYEEGAHTDITRVRDAYKNYMRFKHPRAKVRWPADLSAIETLGYRIAKVHVCNACGGASKGGRNRCCAAYNNTNRSNKLIVQNMRLVAERV
jgi:hypothetical protein